MNYKPSYHRYTIIFYFKGTIHNSTTGEPLEVPCKTWGEVKKNHEELYDVTVHHAIVHDNVTKATLHVKDEFPKTRFPYTKEIK